MILMNYTILKTSVKIGIAAALAIILFQVSNLYLVNKYFKFEYYLTGVSLLFLAAGFLIAKNQPHEKNMLAEPANPLSNLTAKELNILKLISEGKSNKEIAAISFVEMSTIKTHINNMYNKLTVNNRKEAIHIFKHYFTFIPA